MPRDKRKRPAQRAKAKRIKRLAKAHEDCQVNGDIETVPAGPVRNEAVDPRTQGEQPLPGLVGLAVRNGWATPDHKKPRIVDELIGIVEQEDIHPAFKISASRTLQQIDRDQWERDNPELSGKAKGGVKVGVDVNNQQQIILTPQAVLQTILAGVPETKAAKELAELEGDSKNDPSASGADAS